jgi:hypothetical protein
MKLEFSRQIFEKYSDIKFHENPFSGSRVVPCGLTDMTKLTVAFRNFANAPEKFYVFFKCIFNIIFALCFWLVFIFCSTTVPRVSFPCLISKLNVDQIHLTRLLRKWRVFIFKHDPHLKVHEFSSHISAPKWLTDLKKKCYNNFLSFTETS